MAYKHLQSKKRMTPSEFVEARRLAMARATEAFATGCAYPEAVYVALEQKGIQRGSAVLVEDRTPPSGCCEHEFSGLLLTENGRFVAFTISTGGPSGEATVEDFRDVTAETKTDRRVRGQGTTDGCLAQELLSQLRSEGRPTGRCT